MIQRFAIALAGLTAATVLAVGLAAAGFGPRPDGTAVDALSIEATPGQADATPRTERKTVYVRPARKPKKVVVTVPATRAVSARSSQPTRRVRTVRLAAGNEPGDREDSGERDSGREREGHEREGSDD